ncbi:MAG: CinA family protein [Alphaproteobacteria bacterium]|jgi:PncC family amidohydrolase|nr:CinA family protein [Alphaproteobacteria bacterium]
MTDLTTFAAPVAARLIAAKETVAVSESSGGGLISASLLSVPGASSYYLGGGVVYTLAARGALLPDPGLALDGVRSASEPYAMWLARTMREHLGSTWGLAETGASGPTGNRYGDAPGHTCIAVSGPREKVVTLETGQADRQANMWAFTQAALSLLATVMEGGD